MKLYRSQVTRQILMQYCFTIFAFACIYVALVMGGWSLSARIVWQPYDPLYQILHLVKEYLVLVTIVVGLVAWAIITYVFISKPLRYLDEVVLAAEQLAVPGPEPISLPVTLKNVQDELNLVREEALRNALAAKEAEQRKNDLIVYLAHDLKTPLTSVLGYLTLLRDEPQISPELRAKYTGIALDKAARLEELIDEFFDITRFNLTAISLEEETVDLSRLLEQTMSEFTPLLAEKDLDWASDLAPRVRLLCDPDKLQRVFDNLLRNAVNYSYRGGTIAVSLERAEDRVVVRVRNRGKTIPQEKLDRIFEQFFRLDNARASTTGGAGLGLAIAKEIVELHGGTITAESADEAIVFTVSLPDRQGNVRFDTGKQKEAARAP